MRIDESRTACKYTPGRQGRKIVDIVCHHWGVDGQRHDDVVDWFCNPAKGATTSAHFVVSAGRVHCIVSPADTAWHAGQRPQNRTSASSTANPAGSAGARQPREPTAQATSTVTPQERQTRWWWLSPVCVSYRAGEPAGSIRRSRPSAVSAARTL